jgi:hypothetical protein
VGMSLSPHALSMSCTTFQFSAICTLQQWKDTDSKLRVHNNKTFKESERLTLWGRHIGRNCSSGRQRIWHPPDLLNQVQLLHFQEWVHTILSANRKEAALNPKARWWKKVHAEKYNQNTKYHSHWPLYFTDLKYRKKNTGPRVVKLPECQPSVHEEKRIEEPTIAKQKLTVNPFESNSCHYISPSLLRSVKRWSRQSEESQVLQQL